MPSSSSKPGWAFGCCSARPGTSARRSTAKPTTSDACASCPTIEDAESAFAGAKPKGDAARRGARHAGAPFPCARAAGFPRRISRHRAQHERGRAVDRPHTRRGRLRASVRASFRQRHGRPACRHAGQADLRGARLSPALRRPDRRRPARRPSHRRTALPYHRQPASYGIHDRRKDPDRDTAGDHLGHWDGELPRSRPARAGARAGASLPRGRRSCARHAHPAADGLPAAPGAHLIALPAQPATLA